MADEPKWAGDEEFEDAVITSVEPGSDGSGWSVGFGSFGLFVPNHGITPNIGDTIRTYGTFGYPVRGIFLNGKEVFYRTPSEQKAHDKAIAEQRDAERRYDAEKKRGETAERVSRLPKWFQDRIARFNKNNPDFWWDHQGYELFCCEQAVVIAEAMRAEGADEVFYRGVFSMFKDMSWEEQVRRVPGLDNGHSGNTFGASCRLAYLYLTAPELVEKEHGAICPVVGCRDLGCYASEVGQETKDIEDGQPSLL